MSQLFFAISSQEFNLYSLEKKLGTLEFNHYLGLVVKYFSH